MKKRLELLMSEKGVDVDQDVHEEIAEAIKANSHEIQSLPTSDFRRLFWDQQVTF